MRALVYMCACIDIEIKYYVNTYNIMIDGHKLYTLYTHGARETNGKQMQMQILNRPPLPLPFAPSTFIMYV